MLFSQRIGAVLFIEPMTAMSEMHVELNKKIGTPDIKIAGIRIPGVIRVHAVIDQNVIGAKSFDQLRVYENFEY